MDGLELTGKMEEELHFDAPRRFDIELFIVHPTMTPAEISAMLKMEPQIAHGIGEQRLTPKDTILEGEYPDTRWRYSVRYQTGGQHFSDKLETFVEQLSPLKPAFAHLRSTGGSAEVILQFLGDGYFGDTVPARILALMAELQLDLGIECFIVPQSS